MQDKWNLRCRIRGNTAPNLRTRGLLAFYFPSLWCYVCVFILFLILARVKLVMEIECKAFILTDLRWNIRSLPCKIWVLHEKNKWPLCHAWHRTYMNCSNSWCFSWAQTQIHSTSCVKLLLSQSSILHFMRGPILFFLYYIFPGHLGKTNLGSGKAGWAIISICQPPHYSEQHKLCSEKNKK